MPDSSWTSSLHFLPPPLCLSHCLLLLYYYLLPIIVRMNDNLDQAEPNDEVEQPSTSDTRRGSFGSGSADESRSVSSATTPHTTSHDNKKGNNGGSGSSVIASKETRNVLYSKWLVYLVLIIAAGTVGGLTYWFLDRGETLDFQRQFDDFATEALDSAQTKAQTTLGKLATIADTLTSYALEQKEVTGQNWPNVTLRNFDIRTRNPLVGNVPEEATTTTVDLYLFAPIVQDQDREAFVAYAQNHQGWIPQDLQARGIADITVDNIPKTIYSYTREQADIHPDFSTVLWQIAPVPTSSSTILMDLFTQPSFVRMISDVQTVQHVLLSEVVDKDFLDANLQTVDSQGAARRRRTQEEEEELDDPRSYAVQPVFDSFDPDTRNLVAMVFAVVPWNAYFANILPPGTEGYVIRVENNCGPDFYYRLDGPQAKYLGQDYQVPSRYRELILTAEFAEFARFDAPDPGFAVHCEYVLHVSPTQTVESEYQTNNPIILMVVVLVVFLFTAMVFVLYDFFVQRRQTKVMRTAQRTTAIVSSLFPRNVQNRILEDVHNNESDEGDRKGPKFKFTHAANTQTAKHHLKNFLGEEEETAAGATEGVFKSKPIADFFPETTIMFGDIVGFTAWSSTREPSQVFALLETIYHEFDQVAKHRRVFKVETVGDCYVAVAGLPDPRKDHAVVMARFARDCGTQMTAVTRRLEVALGPDTADLAIRIGLHSGPVTAGVLRGERARFQLFGDTMNTASRMESTGAAGKIQISQVCADLLVAAGKSGWISPRTETVQVKGKGEMQTYWLDFGNKMASNLLAATSVAAGRSIDTTPSGKTAGLTPERWVSGTSSGSFESKLPALPPRMERYVHWNVELLTRLLQEVVARRKAKGTVSDPSHVLDRVESIKLGTQENPIQEVCEIVRLPPYKQAYRHAMDPADVKLSKEVHLQLQKYVSTIAQMYHMNPFHNFEHASHVTMSVVKLFSRIVAPDTEVDEHDVAKSLHDYTFGITSDPLTQMAVVISALIHDVDHPGVPNNQLIEEESAIASMYNNKSIAEQNSVDLAWSLLMRTEFTDLRRTIYTTKDDFHRFRQTIVNVVLATDIMDKDLKSLRNNRWDKAFSSENSNDADDPRDAVNRKATIVMEHLIQASDVAHTMQHWHIYRKWNARLFEEMYKAWMSGRAKSNPADNWYKGEMGFYDFYIIPLAKKLKDCGVFGVSSAEYLQYALNNRSEWEQKGEGVVAELIAEVTSKYGVKQDLPPGDEAKEETETEGIETETGEDRN